MKATNVLPISPLPNQGICRSRNLDVRAQRSQNALESIWEVNASKKRHFDCLLLLARKHDVSRSDSPLVSSGHEWPRRAQTDFCMRHLPTVSFQQSHPLLGSFRSEIWICWSFMPHDTTFFAIFGMLFYFFVPQYFGYAAVAMALWFTVPVIRVAWQTTKDLRDIPDGEERINFSI